MSNYLLSKAFFLVSQAFLGKYDKGGEPYIIHCIEVMRKVSKKNRIPALLHDYVEDIFPNDPQEGLNFLRAEGFSEEDIKVIDILTHRKNEDYLNIYIKLISQCERATEIKKADLEHNSELSRLKGLTKKDFDKAEKYHIAYTYLSKI